MKTWPHGDPLTRAARRGDPCPNTAKSGPGGGDRSRAVAAALGGAVARAVGDQRHVRARGRRAARGVRPASLPRLAPCSSRVPAVLPRLDAVVPAAAAAARRRRPFFARRGRLPATSSQRRRRRWSCPGSPAGGGGKRGGLVVRRLGAGPRARRRRAASASPRAASTADIRRERLGNSTRT